ncbi:MAG: retroviral-like aspartic protease [Candidatus Altiarchaeota archaeon]|nr:retroviral-like aspartic protease [Candidatus Altiarchaeota archaeon]
MALIDSGADYTFIPEDIARLLGIKYTRGNEKTITGIDKELKCVECSLTLILEKDGERHETPITAHVPKYSAKKVGVLLGRQGFFENFDITFREKTGDIYVAKVG